VTVLVELKARFNEEKNIRWADRLQAAGVTILYGITGFKTHAKVCLVIRKELEGIRRYVHLSTGNHNEKTAKLYSDLGYFTSDDQLTSDISSFFNVITGYSEPMPFSKIEISPHGLKAKLMKLIKRETDKAKKSGSGRILAKMNALVDPELIQALYTASNAGVHIKLNVRGTCCLRPGVKGMSEQIQVVSIVDMFLEHSRVFYFSNGGKSEIYLSSADWMPRSFERRIEIMFPIENRSIKKDLCNLLELYFKDNTNAWQLMPSGEYKRLTPANKPEFRIQSFLCDLANKKDLSRRKSLLDDLRPQKPKKK
jgi:polyphosphate kinase